MVATAAAGPASTPRAAAGGKPAAPRPAGAAPKPAAPKPAGRPGKTDGRPGQAPVRPAAGGFAAAQSDLSGLFDELTQSDLQTQQSRDQQAAQAHAAIKDPLAGYGDSGRASGGSLPGALSALAILSLVAAVALLGLGLVLLLAPQWLESVANSVPQIKTHGTIIGGTLLAIGAIALVVALVLLVPGPVRKRLSHR